MLDELRRRVDKFNDNFNKQLENINGERKQKEPVRNEDYNN